MHITVSQPGTLSARKHSNKGQSMQDALNKLLPTRDKLCIFLILVVPVTFYIIDLGSVA